MIAGAAVGLSLCALIWLVLVLKRVEKLAASRRERAGDCDHPAGTEEAEVERLRGIAAAAADDLEAGFRAQWPSGRRPKDDEGWMHFATALDYLRDATRVASNEED